MATASDSEQHTAVGGLGEIALRVNDVDTMQKFYEEVIRLPLMTRVPNCAFFKIADGYGGHTQVLALFDRDLEREKKRLESLGLQVETAEYAWVHWRSLYVTDPEGNQVELAFYDANV